MEERKDHYENQDCDDCIFQGRSCQIFRKEDEACEEFVSYTTKNRVKSELLDKCLADVNPETRNEVRKNMDKMTRDQIKEYYADVVRCVFLAESVIKPTLQERMTAIGKDATPEQKEEVGHQYCLDIAEEILLLTPDEQLEKLYK